MQEVCEVSTPYAGRRNTLPVGAFYSQYQRMSVCWREVNSVRVVEKQPLNQQTKMNERMTTLYKITEFVNGQFAKGNSTVFFF